MSYTVGGNVTGSRNIQVYLKRNGTVVEGVFAVPGPFVFTTQLNAGDTYEVLPAVIWNGQGTVLNTNVTNIIVAAAT